MGNSTARANVTAGEARGSDRSTVPTYSHQRPRTRGRHVSGSGAWPHLVGGRMRHTKRYIRQRQWCLANISVRLMVMTRSGLPPVVARVRRWRRLIAPLPIGEPDHHIVRASAPHR